MNISTLVQIEGTGLLYDFYSEKVVKVAKIPKSKWWARVKDERRYM